MSDIFISYARSTATQAQAVAAGLRGLGYGVWLDDELPAHRAYAEVIEERLKAAKAVVVIWSAEAAKSEWVQSEADRARADHKLVQLTVDGAKLPMPFDRIQCADMNGWTGDTGAAGWRKVVASVAVLLGGERTTPIEGAPLALPTKPSIAVLPFANLSGDAEQDYFADGMVVEITNALSRFKSIFVIASGSSLSLKGQGVGTRDAARRLGVRYVLEGSVRRSANRVRIAVQLVDASDGAQMWAHRFDDAIDDVFDIQDKVALSVAGAIEPALRESEARRASARPIENMGSYDLYLRALALQRTHTQAGMLASIAMLNRALELDPDYPEALAQAAFAHFIVGNAQWSDDPAFHNRSAIEAANHALRVTSDDASVLAVCAFVVSRHDLDQDAAVVLLDRAIALNPGSALVWGMSGVVRVGHGEPVVAIEHLRTALRLDPIGPERAAWVGWIGMGEFQLGKFREAAANIRDWIRQDDIYIGNGFLAASYGHLGQLDAAREALQRYRAATTLPIAELTALFPDESLRRLFREGIALAEGGSPAETQGAS